MSLRGVLAERGGTSTRMWCLSLAFETREDVFFDGCRMNYWRGQQQSSSDCKATACQSVNVWSVWDTVDNTVQYTVYCQRYLRWLRRHYIIVDIDRRSFGILKSDDVSGGKRLMWQRYAIERHCQLSMSCRIKKSPTQSREQSDRIEMHMPWSCIFWYLISYSSNDGDKCRFGKLVSTSID